MKIHDYNLIGSTSNGVHRKRTPKRGAVNFEGKSPGTSSQRF